MLGYSEFIAQIPDEKRTEHSAFLVDAAIIIGRCIENPNGVNGFHAGKFQIIDIVDHGPSLEEFREDNLEEIEAYFGKDLEFLGAEFISHPGDEYWKFDVDDPYKKYWIEKILAEIMQQTFYRN